MQDFQQTVQAILDHIRGVWIRKRYLIICSWLICPVGFFYVASLPDVYESDAQVYVDTRSMLEPLLAGITLYNNPDAEVLMMAQTLKSRSNVEKIARESDLDITVSTDAAYERLIEQLTNGINLSSTNRSNIYTISFTHENPQTARTVVQETLDIFVEGSLGGNRRDSDSATRFIDEQIAEYEARLSEAEQQRADFLRQHSDVLPLQGSFQSKMQSRVDELNATRLLIAEIEQRTESLKGRLTGNRKSTDSFGVQSGSEPAITTRFDERILNAEARLDELKLRFTDQHPDVVETKQLIASLEESREREIEDFLSSEDDDNNPVLSQFNQEITLEISRLEGEIASLRVREKAYVDNINELRSKIDLVPQIEAEGLAKNRNYAIIKEKYEELLSRKEAADISQRAKISSEELQFRIVKPPLVPPEPTGPNRFIYYSGVLIAGFSAGIGIAFLLSQLTPILVRGQQLSYVTGLPVLGSVTHLNLTQIKKKQRLHLALFLISTGILLFLYAVLVAADVMNIDLIGKVIS